MSESDVVKRLENLISPQNLEVSAPRAGRIFVCVGREHLKKVIAFLKDDGFVHLSGITGLQSGDSFELLYHLNGGGILLTVRVNLPLNDDVAPTITDIIPGALLYEREIHDLFGVKFEGHPNLEPLILPEDWPRDVHPMRKTENDKEKFKGKLEA
jgi:NADH:ubiquinone oxidoreductase subunit C